MNLIIDQVVSVVVQKFKGYYKQTNTTAKTAAKEEIILPEPLISLVVALLVVGADPVVDPVVPAAAGTSAVAVGVVFVTVAPDCVMALDTGESLFSNTVFTSAAIL